jgi:hypothetical protein
MKKTLLSFALTLVTLLTFAQNQHLKFKDIPIDGPLAEFVGKLRQQGFVLNEMDGDSAVLEGEFVNETCEIYVAASPISNTVWSVGVYLPKMTSWSSIKSKYHSFKANFTAKYGTPRSYEYFSDPYYEGDGYEMQAVRLEECTYVSFWTIPEGHLKVEISKFEQLYFDYEDRINSEKDDMERNQSIMNDI